MFRILRVVPLVAGIALTGVGIQAAQAQALDANVAGVQTSLATACALDAGVLVNRDTCLAAVSAAIQLAATLPPGLQGQIGVLIGDLIELVPSLADAVTALVLAAGLPALSSGVQIGLTTPGVTSPLVFSPA